MVVNIQNKDNKCFLWSVLAHLHPPQWILHNFPNLKSHFSNQEEIDLLSQKGIYPYDYMNSFERFKETQLPSKESFYNEFLIKIL